MNIFKTRYDFKWTKTLKKGLGMAVIFILATITTQYPSILELGLRDGLNWIFDNYPMLNTLTIGFIFGSIRNYIKYNWLN